MSPPRGHPADRPDRGRRSLSSPAALRTAVEAELAALLAAPGAVAPQGRAVERLTAPLGLEAPGDRALGRGIARAALGAVTGKASP